MLKMNVVNERLQTFYAYKYYFKLFHRCRVQYVTNQNKYLGKKKRNTYASHIYKVHIEAFCFFIYLEC